MINFETVRDIRNQDIKKMVYPEKWLDSKVYSEGDVISAKANGRREAFDKLIDIFKDNEAKTLEIKKAIKKIDWNAKP